MTGGMAACLHQGWLPALLTAVLLSRHSPATDTEPVTSQDAALLAEVPEDILCFSRSFEDLTCFWDEEEASAIHRFYYWYSRDAPTTCAVSTQRSGVSGMRHICVFPSQDVRLFTPLHVLVLDTTTNRTRHRRELSVDAVGLIAPPVNISARWAGAAGQLRVSWQPPLADYPNFFLYEVCYHPMTPTVTPRGTAPGDLPARPTGRAHPPTARGAAASQGTGQVRTGAVGSGPRGSPPPSPLSLGAGAGRHVGGSPGAAAGGEVPHPGAQQARRHLYGWCLGALVGGGGRRDAPLFW